MNGFNIKNPPKELNSGASCFWWIRSIGMLDSYGVGNAYFDHFGIYYMDTMNDFVFCMEI